MNKYAVQHEFDTEPTYVVDTTKAGDDCIIAEFPATLPVDRRRELAAKLASMMNAEENEKTIAASVPFEIGSVDSDTKVTGRVDWNEAGLEIYLDGYGTSTTIGGAPIYLFLRGREGTPTLCAWSDINVEDYTHCIDLSGAKEQP